MNPSLSMPSQLSQYEAGRAVPDSFNVFFQTTLNSLPGEKEAAALRNNQQVQEPHQIARHMLQLPRSVPSTLHFTQQPSSSSAATFLAACSPYFCSRTCGYATQRGEAR